MSSQEKWNLGVASELHFWRYWLLNRGGPGYAWDFEARQNPSKPFDPKLAALIPDFGVESRVLDVGAGPLTDLGYVHDSHLVNIIACDALAVHYAPLLRECKVVPVIQTIPGCVEDLPFKDNFFDLVTCTNALDHTIAPFAGVKEMVRVVKPGGVVVLRHHRNEAVHGKYDGLHQWNLDAQDGRFIIWNPTERVDVSSHFNLVLRLTGEELTVEIRK